MEWKNYELKSVQKQFFNHTSLMSLGIMTIVLGVFFPGLMIIIESETLFVYEISVGLIVIGIVFQILGRKRIKKASIYANEKMALVRGEILSRYSSSNLANYAIGYEMDGKGYEFKVVVGRHSAQDNYLRNSLPVDLLIPQSNHSVCFIREMVEAVEVCEIK